MRQKSARQCASQGLLGEVRAPRRKWLSHTGDTGARTSGAIKRVARALAVWLSRFGYHPANWKVTGSIPGQGTCLGCRFSPRLGHMWKVIDWCFPITSTFLSLSFSLPSPISKIKNRVKFKKRERKSVARDNSVYGLIICGISFHLQEYFSLDEWCGSILWEGPDQHKTIMSHYCKSPLCLICIKITQI